MEALKLLVSIFLFLFDFGQALEIKINRKCCSENQAYDLSTKNCIDSTDSIPNWDYLDKHFHYYTENVADSSFTFESYGFPACQKPERITPYFWHPARFVNFTIFLGRGNKSIIFGLEDSYIYRRKYCLERAVNDTDVVGLIALACKIPDLHYCKNNPCFPVCCPHQHHINKTTNACEPYDDHGNGRIKITIQNVTDSQKSRTRFLYNALTSSDCLNNKTFTLVNGTDDPVYLLANGSLEHGAALYEPGEYCLDQPEVEAPGQLDKWTTHLTVRMCAWHEIDPCSNPPSGDVAWRCWTSRVLIPILFILSCAFIILLTWYVWSTERFKLFGCIKICTFSMLFIFYLTTAKVKFSGLDHIKANPRSCLVEGLLIQFSYLSSMFWLSAMSMDIFRAFRKVRLSGPIRNPRECLGFKHPKFKWYALFSWGLPALVLAVTLTMDNLPIDIQDDIITPGVGYSRCFLDQGLPTLLYFHIITAPLFVINVAMYIFFLWNMVFGVWAHNPQIVQRSNKRLKAILKLFLVMGLTWTLESISWGLDQSLGTDKLWKLIIVFDIINALQGVIMFIVIYFDGDRVKDIRTMFVELCKKNDGHSSLDSPTATRTTSAWSSRLSSFKSLRRKFQRTLSRQPPAEDTQANNMNLETRDQTLTQQHVPA